MLSYRHAFHAGNHADVLKHAVLILSLEYLLRKDKPLWYVDTHAGAGRYRLAGAEAQKNAEFCGGISRLRHRAPQAPLLRRYLELVAACNPGEELQWYPGSPDIAMQLLRPQDCLRLFEKHPQDFALLAQHSGGDRRVLAACEDGFAGLKALLPPPSRRALVLIDPPYELKEDYRRVVQALAEAHRRFATGTYLIWYPLLPRAEAQQLPGRLAALGLPSLRVELQVEAAGGEFGMYGSGLFAVNPPWPLYGQLEELLPLLRDVLGLDEAASFRLEQHGLQ